MLRYFSIFRYSLFLIVCACAPRGTNESLMFPSNGPDNQIQVTHVDFNVLKTKIIDPFCIQCHADFSEEKAVLAYVKPGDLDRSIFYKDIVSGRMPPNAPLSKSKQELVANYILGLGSPAPKPSVSPSPVPSSGPIAVVDFALIKAKILIPACIDCHENFSNENGLKPYIVAGQSGKSSLFTSIQSGSMPPGGPALSPEDTSLIKRYIDEMK